MPYALLMRPISPSSPKPGVAQTGNLPPGMVRDPVTGNLSVDPRLAAAYGQEARRAFSGCLTRSCTGCLVTLLLPIVGFLLILVATRILPLPYLVYYNPWTYLSFSAVDVRGIPGGISSLTWSPDGTRLAASARGDDTVHIADAATGRSVLMYTGHTAIVQAVAWSPDGTRIASADQGQLGASAGAANPSTSPQVRVWNPTNGKTLLVYHGHRGPIEGLAWSPDGRSVASVSQDNTLQIWSARTGRTISTFPQGGLGARLAWSPDGRLLAAAHDGQVVVWNVATHSRIFTYMHPITHDSREPISWSPDSRRLAMVGYPDRLVQIWDVRTKRVLLRYRGHIIAGNIWFILGSSTTFGSSGSSSTVRAVNWAPSGRWIASSDGDSVQVWDAASGDTVASFESDVDAGWRNSAPLTTVNLLAWDPASKRLAMDSHHDFIRIWRPGGLK